MTGRDRTTARRAVTHHQIAGVQLRGAQRIAKFGRPCAQARCTFRALRPQRYGGANAAQRDLRMHAPDRIDIDRKPRSPHRTKTVRLGCRLAIRLSERI